MKTTIKGRLVEYIFPFFKAKTKYKIQGHRISVDRAPEPTDIKWVNFGYTESGRMKRKVLFSIVSLFALLVSAGLTFGIAKGY